ncbi:MAG: peptidoglycan-associated lipoprotein Pal [bacterium]
MAGAVLALVMVAVPLPAQQPGTVELGPFGRFTRLDRRGAFDDVLSISGRLGLFILPQVSLEADISRGQVEDRDGVESNFTPFHARLLYNRPIGGRTDLLVGAGYAWYDYGRTNQRPADEHGIGGLLGLRFWLGDHAALRLDGTVDHMPAQWAGNRGTAVRRPDGTAVVTFKSQTHFGVQAGLSLLWNLWQRRGEPPVATTVEPPPPQPETPATPQPSERAAEPPAEPTPADRTAEETARARAIIEEVVHFDFDRSDIRPDAAAILERKARVLKANPNLVVRIEGHTDERGSTEYNLALGQRRAESVKAHLVSLGVPASQLETLSLGESQPVDPASNEEAWAKNRRAEFRVVRGGEALRLPQQ